MHKFYQKHHYRRDQDQDDIILSQDSPDKQTLDEFPCPDEKIAFKPSIPQQNLLLPEAEPRKAPIETTNRIKAPSKKSDAITSINAESNPYEKIIGNISDVVYKLNEGGQDPEEPYLPDDDIF